MSYVTTIEILFFFCLYFFPVFFLNSFKPKLIYHYLSKSLRKQQLKGILLNLYVFNLINFTKLCSLLATFFDAQQIFQRCLIVVGRVYYVATSDNAKSTLKQRCVCQRWNLKRSLFQIYVESMFSISTLILTTLDYVEKMLLFSTSSFKTLIGVETTLWTWPFSKSWKEQEKINEPQKKDDLFA